MDVQTLVRLSLIGHAKISLQFVLAYVVMGFELVLKHVMIQIRIQKTDALIA